MNFEVSKNAKNKQTSFHSADFLPLFLTQREKTAPQTATNATMVAAMRNGGGRVPALAGITSVREKAANKTTRSSRTTGLFSAFTVFYWQTF
jgi:hypothetical protein